MLSFISLFILIEKVLIMNNPPKSMNKIKTFSFFSVSEHVFEIYIKDRKLIKYKNKDCK